MILELKNGCLVTNYYTQWESQHGIPWVLVVGNVWHIVLAWAPSGPKPEAIHARPVTSPHEKDFQKWRWRLEIGAYHLPLYGRCFVPFRPQLIKKWTYQERFAIMWTRERRIWHRCPLWLVRDDKGTRPTWWEQRAKKRRRD